MQTLYFFAGLTTGSILAVVAIAVYQLVQDRRSQLIYEDEEELDLYFYEECPDGDHVWRPLGPALSACSVCGSLD